MDPNAGKKNLVNRYSREELEARLMAEDFKRITVSFYRYVILDDPQAMRDRLYQEWTELNCLGRIYVAREGINAQMNVPEQNWEQFVKELHAKEEFKDIPFKIAVEDDGKSFLKLVIKVRDRIVADGLADDHYDVTNVGTHLDAESWNQALEEGAIVVDMRNHYESEIGHFENSILPQAETFREELPEVLEKLKGKESDKILLYCTGGIRCEKTSAFLKHHGFTDVNQLHGGIIDYARQIKTKELPNKFHGKNFVFDERLGESISHEVISHCHQCGEPCDVHVNCANVACNLLFIQCPTCAEKYDKCCSEECMEVQHLSAEEQKELRKGKKSQKRFHSHRRWGDLHPETKS
ncbi:oxygen-dependent tRNA uridine(34) hydroxylase TrhO [Croceimicrobium hydrocarbonivorans]|uniref:tRNA uridine(34) hydroxylase n=1 Tax=Croceimicrobium hydrocarbonivorans TaxID=2761580 RepID=A0A7H0VIC2_9FLAO|nr:rhodanese-related sulfurtransferase [Croceimicrobium hydrocarbonivorans]QNR25470.1 rhodanese-related sulfurtransferase [Croceimicrobium hydrocarbonivorans]